MKNILLILCLISFSINCFAWTCVKVSVDGVILWRTECRDGSLAGFASTQAEGHALGANCAEGSHYDGDLDLYQMHLSK